MFGSHLDHHPTVFRFTVRRAQRVHSDLAYDRYCPDSEAEQTHLMEFDLSATQFVELMTSLNMGEGIPCTLTRVIGTQMDPVPDDHATEAVMIAQKFGDEMRDVAASVKPLTDSINEVLGKKGTINKSDRQTIADAVFHIVKRFGDHAPFVMKQFNESTDRMRLGARTEVEAYATSVILAAGIEHLRQLKEQGGDGAVQQAIDALDVTALAGADD